MTLLIRKIILFALLLIGVTGASFSQERLVEKANEKFDRFSYIDARQIYLKIVERGYESPQIYKKLGDTYYYNGEYEAAAKWYSKLIDKYPNFNDPEYYYRAAQSLKSINKTEEADALMEAYKEKGGDDLIAQNFENDPNYLSIEESNIKTYNIDSLDINTDYSDFGPSYYKDNKIVYATASNITEGNKVFEWNNQPFLDLFIADLSEYGIVSNPKALQGSVNTEFHESSSTFTKDGNTLYFTRNSYIDGEKQLDSDRVLRLKLYRATLNDGKWSNVSELPFNIMGFSTAHPALSKDEKRLYFSSDRPGTFGMSDLWYVDILAKNSYGKPINLGPGVNTEARESFPFISQENNLYFSSDGRAGLGGFDIFVTELDDDGKAGEIFNMGEPINSSKDDIGFITKEEDKSGFFSSNRSGETGSIADQIYSFKELCEVSITGEVTDEDTGELLPGAKVTLLDEKNRVIDTLTVGDDARFTFIAECNKKYAVRGIKDRYLPNEKIIEKTPNENGNIDIPLPLKLDDPCPPNDLGCRLTLQPIYFDFDKSNIRPDAEIELAKILAAMEEYPELIIAIESHTDSRGTDAYNLLLSERRAQSTLNWFIDNGIDKSRLSAKGYGETQLVNQCANGVECTDEEHQLNRRSLFLIQN